MLALLALAPLLGLAFLSFDRISEANQSRSNLDDVQVATTDLVDAAQLHAAIQNENFWLSMSRSVEALGFSPDFIASALGIDSEAQLARAQEQTDVLVERSGINGLAEELTEARQLPVSDSGVVRPLDGIETGIAAESVRTELERVIALAAEQPDGSQLVVLARKLQGANEVRSSFSGLRAAFFANFGELDVEARRSVVLELSRRLTLYEREVTELDVLIPPSGAMEAPFNALIASESRAEALAAVDEVLEDFGYITTGAAAPDPAEPQVVSSIVTSFVAAETANIEHLDLVASAADVLTDAVEAQRAEAQQTAVVVLIASVAVALLTAVAIVVTTQWIVRPLTDLGGTALVLSLGSDEPIGDASGPREIRLIHEALTEAITNLERTEQQALALADGELDDPSLDQVVPGRFGATLHAAIEQLRHSISNQERFSEQLAYEAGHDGLTGLANRRAAIDFLTASLGRQDEAGHEGTPASLTTVFFIDLDHFKAVNDTQGHAAGDEVLCSVSDALRASARDVDMVGRIGGDEFLIVSNGPASMDEAKEMGDRCLAVINQSLDEQNSGISASIGVSMGCHGDDVDALLAEADVAMLEAKKHGRDAVRLFDGELRARTLDELTLGTNIRAGLAAGEFELHYQPIVNSVSGDVLDYEALIRWDRPGVGRVSPDDYIPFAERSDLVIDIDRWVLDQAAETLASNALDGIGIAVNISGRHLATGDLFGDLTEVLARTGINPRFLTVEITESALLGDIDGAIETLRRIRATGVKVAIDDFGTGFTSLTHLRSLPADVLKIDQSFTSNLDNSDDANLVRLVIQTAHILRLDVVVEGVETIEHAQRVTMLGADQMQGYHFAKPLPLHEIVAARSADASSATTPPTSSHR